MGGCFICRAYEYENPHWWVYAFWTWGSNAEVYKTKLNTKSSTEVEVVVGSDYITNVIYIELFLKGQVIIFQSNEYNQDNQSAMKLISNGKRSCGPGSRYIDIRFVFMKNRFDTDNINVVYCPTSEILADFYTKPLQGTLFRRFRDVIIG